MLRALVEWDVALLPPTSPPHAFATTSCSFPVDRRGTERRVRRMSPPASGSPSCGLSSLALAAARDGEKSRRHRSTPLSVECLGKNIEGRKRLTSGPLFKKKSNHLHVKWGPPSVPLTIISHPLSTFLLIGGERRRRGSLLFLTLALSGRRW